MSFEDDLPQRDRWARLRFAIIGPLLAAPPASGELHQALTVLAGKTWRHPFTGLDVRFGVSTIERWLYAAKRAADPVRALRCRVRRDIGRFPSLSAEAVAALTTQYGNHPGWTAYWQACQYAVNPKHTVMRRKLVSRLQRPFFRRSASHYLARVILPVFTGRSHAPSTKRTSGKNRTAQILSA